MRLVMEMLFSISNYDINLRYHPDTGVISGILVHDKFITFDPQSHQSQTLGSLANWIGSL